VTTDKPSHESFARRGLMGAARRFALWLPQRAAAGISLARALAGPLTPPSAASGAILANGARLRRPRVKVVRLALLACGICPLILTAACARRMLPPKPYLAFAAVRDAHCLAIVDLGNFEMSRTVPMGFAPERLTICPKSHELYVISQTGDVGLICYPDFKLTQVLHIGPGCVSLCFSADGSRGYVAGAGRHEIVVLTGHPPRVSERYRVKLVISRLAVTPDGKTLLVESAAQHQLEFIRAEDGHVLGSVPLSQNPGQMLISPDGSKAFITDAGQEAVSAADILTRQMLSQIEVGSMPSLLALKPDGGEIFAISSKSSTITLLDTSSDSVEQALPTGSSPVAVVFTRNSRIAYIADAGDGTIMTLDVQNRETLASTRIGVQPVALALTPDQRFLAVADAGAGGLAIMRARVPTLITTIPVGGDPVDVAIPGWLSRGSADAVQRRN
jgi:YVTN family beta-propeller protein